MKTIYPFSMGVMDTIKHDYEQFRLRTADQIHQGLFSDGNKVYAVVDAKSNIENLQKICDEWSTAAIPSPIITHTINDSFFPIPLRNEYEKIYHFGRPINRIEFHDLLHIHIPKKFHPIQADVKWGTNNFLFISKIKLSDEEQEEIKLICESIGFQGYNYIFQFDPNIPEYSGTAKKEPNTYGNLQLVPSSFIQKQFHRSILDKYEEDEEFWIENKYKVFSADETLSIKNMLPKILFSSKSKCFVDASIFRRQNLRVYLSIYEIVIISLPFKNHPHSTDFYSMFNVSRHELQELLIRERLLFVIPQNLIRYQDDLLCDIITTKPDAIIFPRTLASSTILGIQKRTGFISKTSSNDAQYEFLYMCYTSKNQGLIDLANALSHQWKYAEFAVDLQGSVSTYLLGLSPLASEIYKRQGIDFTLEFNSASGSFEVAQGLNAHHFPFDSDSYSEVPVCNIISGLYNGVYQKTNYLQESKLEILLKDILAINNDMNILEMDDVLSKNLIRKIPDILAKFATLSEDEKEKKLYELRKDIRQIEKSNDRLQKLDFSGTAIPTIAGAIMAYNGIPEGGYLSLSSWILKALSIYLPSSTIENNPIYTKLQSLNYRVPNETIIIKSYRDSIKSL